MVVTLEISLYEGILLVVGIPLVEMGEDVMCFMIIKQLNMTEVNIIVLEICTFHLT